MNNLGSSNLKPSIPRTQTPIQLLQQPHLPPQSLSHRPLNLIALVSPTVATPHHRLSHPFNQERINICPETRSRVDISPQLARISPSLSLLTCMQPLSDCITRNDGWQKGGEVDQIVSHDVSRVRCELRPVFSICASSC